MRRPTTLMAHHVSILVPLKEVQRLDGDIQERVVFSKLLVF